MKAKTYVINLDGADDRLAFMARQLDAQGVDWVREPAVDLRGEAGRKRRDELASPAQRALSGPELGCTLSHRNIWQRLVGGDDDHAVVLEDDAMLSERFGEVIRDLSWVPEGTHLIKFETAYERHPVAKRGIAIPAGLTLHATALNFFGTAGYIVSRQYAESLLKRVGSSKLGVDYFMFSPRRLTTVYQTVPALCVQTDCYERRGPEGERRPASFGSDIGGAGRHRARQGVSPLARVAGKLFNAARIKRHAMAPRVVHWDGDPRAAGSR